MTRAFALRAAWLGAPTWCPRGRHRCPQNPAITFAASPTSTSIYLQPFNSILK